MKKILAILLLTIPCYVFSQNLQFKNYSAFNGLSTLKTNCVTQGPDGYIWIGSENGLNRFDGVNFRWYTKDINDTNSLPGNIVVSLLVDNNKKLWIATDGGVCSYDKEKEIFHPVKNKRLDTIYCRRIYQDSKNNYWALAGNVISIFDENWNIIKHLNNNPKNNQYLGNVSFFCIEEDEEGTMWLGTQEKGFYSYNLDKDELISYSHLTKEQQILNIFPDSYGHVWISTHNTSYVFIKETRQIYDLTALDCPFNLPNATMFSFFENKDQNLVICNLIDGITIYDYSTNSYEQYTHTDNNNSSLSSGLVEYGYQDDEGNYWFVGATTGLTVSYAHTRKIYKLNDPDYSDAGIYYNPVTAITQDFSGNYWFGTDGGGIAIWNKEDGIIHEIMHNPEDPKSYGGYSMLAAYTDSRGRIWSGGYNSHLNLYNPDSMNFSVFRSDGIPPYQISGTDVRAITEDKDGNIWVATNGGGINIYNPDNFDRRVLTVEDGIAHNYNISILNDQEGNIWIGSYGGLTIYNTLNDSIKVFKKKDQDTNRLQSNWINTLFKDSQNRYWIGTQVGLSLFDPLTGHCKNYLERDGINNHSIMSIEEDNEGNLWIGTMDGMSKLDTNTWTFTNFNIDDGLPDNQLRMGASRKDNDGYLYFGTNKGIFYFLPSDITKNPTVPHIRLTDLFVNNELIKPGETSFLPKSIEYTKKLKLKKEQNFIRINFSALSYYQANKNKFRHYLEGVDKNWVESESNYASYTNLKHGKYSFKVQAFNNDGLGSEIKQISIRVKSKWYNTKLFWLLIISAIIYIIYRFVKEREDQVRRNKEILEMKIRENEELLAEKIKEVESKEQEIATKSDGELEIKYLQNGISKFSDIISKNRENVQELSLHLISELVNYVGANSGIVYVLDDSDKVQQILKPAGLFCANINLREEQYFRIGEGNVGTCFVKKEPIVLNNLPDNYIVLSSGLGNAHLRHCYLSPIIHENTCLGVIELASVKELENYKYEFIKKLSDNFASALALTKANEETKKMLEQNRQQAEELHAQEEEMRQNLEEMQATQEELKRHMEVSKKAQAEMEKEKVLIDTLLKYAPENIYFKDKDSKIIKASQSMAENFKVKNVEDIYGKSDFDFFTEEHARPAFEDEQEIIRTGKPIIDKVEKETHTDGTTRYVSSSKMPLYNEKGEIIGTFGITKDVSQSYKLQEDIKLRNEEMLAQEEELRQNLEEMKAVQENLEEQIENNKKLQEKMEEGNALLNALMDNLPDYIYFKDEHSKFIRISKSMLSLFPVKSLEEMIGKSDFDFQPKEIAQKYFDSEMNIIKTGKGFQDEIAHELMDNGVDQWVSTTKLPLFDKTGKCIGTYGISKNITKIKKQEKQYLVLINKLREQKKALTETIKKKDKEIDKLSSQQKG